MPRQVLGRYHQPYRHNSEVGTELQDLVPTVGITRYTRKRYNRTNLYPIIMVDASSLAECVLSSEMGILGSWFIYLSNQLNVVCNSIGRLDLDQFFQANSVSVKFRYQLSTDTAYWKYQYAEHAESDTHTAHKCKAKVTLDLTAEIQWQRLQDWFLIDTSGGKPFVSKEAPNTVLYIFWKLSVPHPLLYIPLLNPPFF